MKIVHFTTKRADVRAVKPALFAQDQGHETVFVHHIPGFSREAVLRPAGQIFDTLPVFEGGGPSGPELCAKIVEELKPDVVHCHELDQLWALVQHTTREVQRRLILDEVPFGEAGIEIVPPPFPLVYDCHEDELGMGFHRGMLKRDMDTRAWIELATIDIPNCILVVSPSMRDRLWKRYREPYMRDLNPLVVTNAPPAQRRGPHRGRAMKLGRVDAEKNNVFFAGYASPERKIRQLCAAAYELGEAWQLYVLGDTKAMSNETYNTIKGARGRIIQAHPYPHKFAQGDTLNMLDVLSCADVGFAGAEMEIPNWQVGLPNKVFEYAFANVPVVASRMPDTIDLLHRYKIGSGFDGTPRDLMTVLPEVIEQGRRAKQRGGFADFRAEQNYDVTGGPVTMDAYREAIELRG